MRRLFTMAFFLPLISFSQYQIVDSNSQLNCNWTEIIHNVYFKYHYSYTAKSADLEKKAIDQLIKDKDPKKNLFYQSDAEKIRELSKNLFNKLEKKDCGFLEDIQKVAIARATERFEFAKKLITPQFKVDAKINSVENPTDFFDSQEAAQNFWSKSLQLRINQLVNLNYTLAEAKTQAVRDHEISLNVFKKTRLADLLEQYFVAFSLALDPHSSFAMVDKDEEKNYGIGVEIVEEKGAFWIKKILPQGPAAKSGQLRVGDRITAVQKRLDMQSTAGMDETELSKLIRGPLATKVKLTVERNENGKRKVIEAEILRDFVTNPRERVKVYFSEQTVESKKKVIAVIHVPSFYSDFSRRRVSNDVRSALLDSEIRDASAVVLDLSTNPGGYVAEAGIIGGLFIKSGNIARALSRGESEPDAAFEDLDETLNWNRPLVILVSKKSASAAEILAASLKDYRRALIVGSEQTFGKGSFFTTRAVPRFIAFVAVTGGLYFSPSGTSPQFQGVTSDIVLPYSYEEPITLEKDEDNVIPSPKPVPPFFSREANGLKGSDRWIPLKAEWIKSLALKSKQRMNTQGTIKKTFKKISEISETEYLNQADIKEAAQIAAELSVMVR